MKEGILPGALVYRIGNSAKGPKAGELCTVLATSFYGGAIWLVNYGKPYSSEHFELLYNDFEDFDHEWDTEGNC